MSYKSKEIYRIGYVSSIRDRCQSNGMDSAQPVGREFSSREGKLGVALGAIRKERGGLELLAKSLPMPRHFLVKEPRESTSRVRKEQPPAC